MPNLYCRSCGTGTKYSFTKPETCPSCSKPFAKPLVIESIATKPIKQKTKRVIEEEDEEDEDDFEEQEEFFSASQKRQIKNALANIQVIVDKPTAQKIGEIIGSDPNHEEYSRQGVSLEEYKNRLLKPKDNSID